MSRIGWLVRLKMPMLGNEKGALGFVFNQYPDFDGASEPGVQVIFPNGEYGFFPVQEQKQFLEFLCLVPKYAGYQFGSVIQVGLDFQACYWTFEIPHGLIASPEQVREYWLDNCPVCGEPCTMACRCPQSHRQCKNNHSWRRNQDGTAVIESH